jgi:methionyl-tRNA synthetase
MTTTSSQRNADAPSKYLVTPALPYANGSIHLGHLVEHIQVNVFVRALRMAGCDVLYVCGADSHGTPIELSAQKAGIAPEEYTRRCQASHAATFARFFVDFDGGYGTTHTPENEVHAGRIYGALKDKGHIKRRTVDLLFDPEAKRFLPDRMVRGTCPKCKAEDQYGDSCEVCGSTYSPQDLIEPKSVISGATPVMKASEHVFVDLASFTDTLKAWTSREGRVPDEVQNYLARWFNDGLKDWDITRDGPYFGFAIPGETDKYFYVWLDAPIGYISLSERAARERGRTWEEYWLSPSTRIFHFIGKDIVYFHTLFWPAMLMASSYTLPERISVHGMLTVDGVKMSKSRGTFINGDDFAELLGENGTQALRYYYACKLTGGVDDIDLSFDDFCARVNADLVNNVVNLLSRTVPMIHRFGAGKTGTVDEAMYAGALARGLVAWSEHGDARFSTTDAPHVLARARAGEAVTVDAVARAVADAAETAYRDTRFADVVRLVTGIASEANKILQDEKPWDIAKSDVPRGMTVLTTALSVGKLCVGLLGPIVPDVAHKTSRMLGMQGGFTFANATTPLAAGQSIETYPRLFERLDPTVVHKLVKPVDDDKKTGAPTKKGGAGDKTAKAANPSKTTPEATVTTTSAPSADGDVHITIDDLMKVDLRAARVLAASDVEGADKLISVSLDVGPLGKRHVFAGLKPHVKPADLVGKTLVLVANLKPRKMKFGMSEGMLLAAGEGVPRPLTAEGAEPGDKIR